jgi:hypothetical protein
VLEPDAYGTMKRAGEAWVKALKLGKIVRLWNVYGAAHRHKWMRPSLARECHTLLIRIHMIAVVLGAEPIGEKSHVIADWSHGCINKGAFHGLTDGTEVRMVSRSHLSIA